ncbi:MAG: 6-phosphogluconolactonase [Pseudomonadota bacterium]
MPAKLHLHDMRDQAIEALAKRIEGLVEDAVTHRGHCTMALAGGSTPLPLYERLGQLPLPWSKVTVTLGDERWVATDDPQSNERLLRRSLLSGPGRAARLVGLRTAAPSPEAALPEIEARLAGLRWPLDFVLLGMGEDGHTASLFPSLPPDQLRRALAGPGAARVIACHPASSPVARISMTLPALLDSHMILLLMSGDAKRRVLDRAVSAGPLEALPVRGILHQQRVPVEITWFP